MSRFNWILSCDAFSQPITQRHEGVQVDVEKTDEYYRDQWKNPIEICRRDFDLIMEQPIDTEYSITFQENIDGVFLDRLKGVFSLSDCEYIDEDNRELKVKPRIDDDYKEIIDNWDTKVDFVKENIPTSTIKYRQKPILQVYVAGSSKITNFADKRNWEQNVETVAYSDEELTDDYKFNKSYDKYFVIGDANDLNPNVGGIYEPQRTLFNVGNGRFDYIVAVDPTNQYYIKNVICDRIFHVPGGSMLDDSDVGSIWQDAFGYQYKYIQKQNKVLHFQSLDTTKSIVPNRSLTHVSGATHTSSISYREAIIYVSFRSVISSVSTGDFLYLGTPFLPHTGVTTSVSEYVRFFESYEANDGLGLDLQTLEDNLKQLEYSAATFNSSPVYTSTTDGSQTKAFGIRIYSRLLTNLQSINNQETTILQNDIIPKNNNLERVHPITLSEDYITPYDGHQSSRTDNGQYSEDAVLYAEEYFTEPNFGQYTDPASGLLKLQKSLWSSYSLWIVFEREFYDSYSGVSQLVTFEYAYSLKNIISFLLSYFDSNVSFSETIQHSQFFYGEDIPVRGKSRKVFITPKSNITISSFSSAATRGEISIKDVFDMLKNVYNVYWYIDSNSKLILEHKSWFDNGGSYSNQIIGADLTTDENTRTKKLYSYKTKKYRYDLGQIPSRIVFGWMDSVSDIFEGEDIVINSNYADSSSKEERLAGIFTSDLDYAIANADSISKDGFFLLETEIDQNGVDSVAVWQTIYENQILEVQNGYLSFVYLHDSVYRYSLPGKKATVNGIDIDATTVRRTKVQEVDYINYPFDPIKLIKTSLGVGKIRRATRDITPGYINTELEHDTE